MRVSSRTVTGDEAYISRMVFIWLVSTGKGIIIANISKLLFRKISCQVADNTHLDWLTKLYNDCSHSFITTHIQAGNIH